MGFSQGQISFLIWETQIQLQITSQLILLSLYSVSTMYYFTKIKWHHFPVTKQIWIQLYVGKIFCPLSQVFRHSFLKSNTVSLFRGQFPLKSGLEFRWNNSFWICSWYLPFFSETAHFLPKIAAHGQNSLHPLKLFISPKTMSARKTFLCCAGCIAGHK